MVSKPALAVVACTLLALIVATLWVPKRLYNRLRIEQFSAAYLEGQRAAIEAADYSPAHRPAGRALYRGEWVPNDQQLGREHTVFPDAPDQFCWIWEKRVLTEAAFDGEDRIVWPIVCAVHALILLVAGGLLTLVRWRELRARSLRPSP
ncbi:MAG: hypothetical protein ACYTGX_04130 [Planctomycetota bacterium]